MNRAPIKKLVLLLSFLGLAFPSTLMAGDCPRLYAWGLAGSEDVARGDLLLPLFTSPNSLIYNDWQGRTSSNGSWSAGTALGYRAMRGPGIFGGYLFVDRDVSNCHDYFTVLNPGLEFFSCNGYDLRVNGYLPLSDHRKNFTTDFFASDTCGANFNTDSFVFKDHQQFTRRFHRFAEIGPGADIEVAKHIRCLNDFVVALGGYYYNEQDAKDITGVEARLVFPVKPTWAVTAEASYDKWQHGVFVGGLRIQLGRTCHPPSCFRERLYDPIIKDLGAIKQGSGIPIVKGVKDDGLFLYRDNIYFFTANGGTNFAGAATGTFENPLNKTQFTQTTVDGIAAITANANLFFNSGTYVINAGSPETPNARISLPGGQSIFGRTPDFKQSATGDNRPLFLGGLDLFAGNNTLDSIRLLNQVTSTGDNTGTTQEVIGIDIDHAPNVLFCNDDISVNSIIAGNNVDNGVNTAIGIRVNSASTIEIQKSTLNVLAKINGSNLAGDAFGDNAGSLVTGNNGQLTINRSVGITVTGNNNSLNLDSSFLEVNAIVGGNNSSGSAFGEQNSNVTAGGNENTASNLASGLTLLGDANTILISNTEIISNALIIGENQAGIAIGSSLIPTGDGGAQGGSVNLANNTATVLNLQGLDNELTISNSNIVATATVNGNNESGIGIGGNAIGSSSSIGLGSDNNIANNLSQGILLAGNTNVITTTDCSFEVLALIKGDNRAGLGIGGVGGTLNQSAFGSGGFLNTAQNVSFDFNIVGNSNQLSLSGCSLNSNGTIQGNNRAGLGIGGVGSGASFSAAGFGGNNNLVFNTGSGISINGNDNTITASNNSFSNSILVNLDNQSGVGFGGIGSTGQFSGLGTAGINNTVRNLVTGISITSASTNNLVFKENNFEISSTVRNNQSGLGFNGTLGTGTGSGTGSGGSTNTAINSAFGLRSTGSSNNQAQFQDNTWTISAIVNGDNISGETGTTNNASINNSAGVFIQGGVGNQVNLLQDTFDISSIIFGNNTQTGTNNQAINTAFGLFATGGNSIFAEDCFFKVSALVKGTNNGTNQALGTSGVGTITTTGSVFDVTSIP